MKVSVVINYKADPLIHTCLKALEKQTFKDFEVILVDASKKRLELKGYKLD